jgi:hypothetical protein
MDSKRFIKLASAIMVGAIFCIIFNQSRKKSKKVGMIYFDEHRGFVEINVKE